MDGVGYYFHWLCQDQNHTCPYRLETIGQHFERLHNHFKEETEEACHKAQKST